ncbi:MAG: PepSY domain-containing protein [Solirubrobacteraceae bacterium]
MTDTAVATARAHGLRDPMSISVPTVDGRGFTVTEARDRWPMRRDAMALDPTGRAVTDAVRFADWSLVAKLAGWGIQAHMGNLFGIVNQIVLASIAIALLVLIVLGYRMWWARRPRTRMPARGAWRHVDRRVLAVLIVAAAVVGWCLPVLGVTLVAFLVVDAVVGYVAGRRRRTA